ncbi:oligosaccharide flippase family protein [Nocardioides sp. KIGAM211]|uniref:Oligosaccharide flippase family protein n=1 Tax=Nocardioides luti TaxID=2761101 RepID=A0A7X0RJ58_9ACTN|nr:oligosaccharide flippase family protein [Nocardioides luti]MBB6629313.1 oligosaccharide flippase family protein [Nocardioides luti]
MSEYAPVSADPAQRPHWTVGDRLAAFTALLPADPAGPVVLALSDELSPHVQLVYPEALVLVESGRDAAWPDGSRVVAWDGRTPPVRAGSAGLVVVDARRYDRAALATLLSPEGVLAVLGPDGPFLVYPSAESPELVWRRSWPVNMPAGPVPWLRRRLGLSVGRGDAVPRLSLSGVSRPSLADEVLVELQEATGRPGELVGLVTAGHAVLRVRSADGDVAVRLSLTDGDRHDVADRVRADVPAVEPYLAPVVARGRTRGHPWVATRWTPGRRGPLTWPWPRPERQWAVADEVVDVLSARVTGSTGPGWAQAWAEAAHVVPPDVRARWAAALAPLEAELPTAWCHGDLWPGNVLLDGGTSAVIDWDNASEDAVQGLDRLLVPALRALSEPGRNASTEILRFVDDVAPVADAVVGGRRWADWDRPARVALALATVVLYLRNRSLHDLGQEALDTHLAAVAAALEPSGPDDAVVAAAAPAPNVEAARTARGALWLATNGVVVKASQTIVLLTLAAILAPSALGLVALGTLVANISVQLSSLGTASALVYWRGDVQRAARTAVTIGVGMGAGLAVLLWVAAPWLATTLRAEDGGAAVIRGLTVVLPFTAVAAVTNELLRRELRFLRRIIPDTVSSITGAVVAIALVTQGHGVMALVAGQIVQATLTMLLSWVVHPPVRPGWNREDARGLLGYGGPYAGAQLLEIIQLNVDYLIVARVLGAVALGQYSLGFRLAFMPYLMIVVVTTGAAFPYLCRVSGPALGRASTVVMTATLTMVVPLCAGLALFNDDLTLLGDKWSPGVPVVGWLALYAVLLSVGQIVQTALNAGGRPGVAMLLRLSHLVLLLGTLLVVASHGITAVAVGQVVAASLVATLALTLGRIHLPGFSLRGLAVSLRPAAAGVAVMVVAVLGLRALFDVGSPSLSGLLLVGSAGVVAYAGTVWMLDRAHLKEAFQLVRRPS